MSVWSTKKLDRDRNYIVIKHKLPSINHNVNGIKFRGGYAVIEKDSKVYNMIKRLPFLRGAPEFPLIHLRQLSFITRTKDVLVIFGKDVYYYYLQDLEIELQKETQQATEVKETEHTENSGCTYRTIQGKLCKFEAFEYSPSKFCRYHLLKDTGLEELGLALPKFSNKDEKKKHQKKVVKALAKLGK